MIPVIYLHLGPLPAYLIRSIEQAKKVGNQVTLLCDTAQTIDGIQQVQIDNYLAGVTDFETRYKHMSSNTADFEIICIKRWLILANYMHQNNLEVCYYSDSDVMLYADVNIVYEDYKVFDACYTLPKYQGNFRWSASACCSFWKQETLHKFATFILEAYTEKYIGQLEEKWDFHQQHQLSGGICDMTLLYLFSKQINFYSLSQVKNGAAFDQNFLDDENYFKAEYEMEMLPKIKRVVKKISWENEIPYAYNLHLNQKIKFYGLTEYARYTGKPESVSLKTFVYRKVQALKGKANTLLQKKEKPHGWFGNYSSWEAAEKECAGYSQSSILEQVKNSILHVKNGTAAYERDSVLFDEIQYSPALVKSLNESIQNNQLHLLDFGGSLGSSYFQHRGIFPSNLDLKWAVVEQAHFVESGKKEIEENGLKFYSTIDEALQFQDNQVLLLSSVLAYFKSPYEIINTILTFNFEFIIVDRTAFIEGNQERITKQIVPEFIYKASYPAWFFVEAKFIAAFTEKYELIREFKSAFDPDGVLEDGAKVYRKGFYFKRKQLHD